MPATLASTASSPAAKGEAIEGARCSRAGAAPLRRARVYTTEALFAGASEVEIQHGEAIYRLRITSLGKLILTK